MANTFNIENFVSRIVVPPTPDKDGKIKKGAKSSTVYEFLGFTVENKPTRAEAKLGRKSTFENFRAGKSTVNKLYQGFEKYGVGVASESYTKILDLSAEELHSNLKLYVKEIQEKNPESPEIFRSILTWLRDDSATAETETNPQRTCLNLFCSSDEYEKLDLSDENRAKIFAAWKENELKKIAEMEKMANQISEEDAVEYSMSVFSKYGVDEKKYLRFKAVTVKEAPAAPSEEKTEELPTLA